MSPKSKALRTIVNVKVKPGSSRAAVTAYTSGVLDIKLVSPPVEGKANQELIKVLSKTFKVSKSSIELLSGAKSRTKKVSIKNFTPEQFNQRLRELQII